MLLEVRDRVLLMESASAHVHWCARSAGLEGAIPYLGKVLQSVL